MKKLKKQWNKVTVLLLTFGIVFGLFGAVTVQAQDGNASGNTIFDVKIVHTNDIHAREGIDISVIAKITSCSVTEIQQIANEQS